MNDLLKGLVDALREASYYEDIKKLGKIFGCDEFLLYLTCEIDKIDDKMREKSSIDYSIYLSGMKNALMEVKQYYENNVLENKKTSII